MCLNVPLRGLQHTCTTVVCVQFFSSLPVFQKQPAQEFAMSCNIPKLHPTPTLSHCSRHTRGKSRCCMAPRFFLFEKKQKEDVGKQKKTPISLQRSDEVERRHTDSIVKIDPPTTTTSLLHPCLPQGQASEGAVMEMLKTEQSFC